MGRRALPSPEILRELLRYEPETGKLFWRQRNEKWFKPTPYMDGTRSAGWAKRNWNTKFADKEAFTHIDRKGYRKGAVLSVNCCAHRIAWSIFHGEDAPEFIDHINGNASDNRIENLRAATCQDNARNAKLYSSNKSGTPGVMWEDSHKAWAVKINIAGKQRRIGRFKLKADAISARKAAERAHGYHPNHGRAA